MREENATWTSVVKLNPPHLGGTCCHYDAQPRSTRVIPESRAHFFVYFHQFIFLW